MIQYVMLRETAKAFRVALNKLLGDSAAAARSQGSLSVEGLK
jgi:hypothetical protein